MADDDELDFAEFEIIQDGAVVATSFGPRERAAAEARHYGRVYGQDGPVEIREVFTDDSIDIEKTEGEPEW